MPGYEPRPFGRAWFRLKHDGRADYAMHIAHRLAARLTYRLRPGAADLNTASRDLMRSLKERGYGTIEDGSIRALASERFAPAFSYLRDIIEAWGDSFRPVPFINHVGYVGRQFDATNQVHAPDLPPHAIGSIADFLEASGLGPMFRNLYGSNYGVCNARVWRYGPKIGHMHDFDIGCHTDGLPPHAWKLMFFDGIVGPDDGALTLVDENGSIMQRITGDHPMVVFDSNTVRHFTTAPRATHRYTLELTIIPQLRRCPRIIAAGYQAGYPRNPFRSWARPTPNGIITCTE